MDCSKTIDFMKEKARLCESMKHPDDCWTKCPLGCYCLNTASDLSVIKGIAALQKWSDEQAANNDRQNNCETPWISVKDRLPEKEEFVIAIVSGKPHEHIILDETPMIATYYPVDAEWSLEEFPEWDNPDVKYWMPVPDLPGGVK